MLSIQAVRGLPRLRAPGTVPCIISFSYSCRDALIADATATNDDEFARIYSRVDAASAAAAAAESVPLMT